MHRPLILALDASGHPHRWTTWEDAVTLKVKGLISYEYGDETDTIYGGVSRMTGVQSTIDIAPIIAIRGSFKHIRRTPILNNRNLFKRDLNICAYCGKHFSDDNLTRDHIVPVSRGGKDIYQNCVSACKRCNNRKDNLLLTECHMELLYVPYVPCREEMLILANRRILASQMDFLKAFLPEQSRLL